MKLNIGVIKKLSFLISVLVVITGCKEMERFAESNAFMMEYEGTINVSAVDNINDSMDDIHYAFAYRCDKHDDFKTIKHTFHAEAHNELNSNNFPNRVMFSCTTHGTSTMQIVVSSGSSYSYYGYYGYYGYKYAKKYNKLPGLIFSRPAGEEGLPTTITQWGTNAWKTLRQPFRNIDNLVVDPATSPNLCVAEDLLGMFALVDDFNSDISAWDMHNVRNTASMFRLAKSFNQDISTWDVSNVETMASMFLGADSFNQDISAWDVSNVDNMFRMFASAISFNQDINAWQMSGVSNVERMFEKAASFNQPLDAWVLSSVTNMNAMFLRAKAFNQDISVWDVSGVTDMSNMFDQADSFNQDISVWDVSNVTDMTRMFYFNDAFDQDLSSWDVSNVTAFNEFATKSPIEGTAKLPSF